MRGSFGVLLIGVLWIVIGLVLQATVLSTAATAGADANAPSFAGARSINDLVPLIYNMVVAVGAAALIGVGAYGMGKRALQGG